MAENYGFISALDLLKQKHDPQRKNAVVAEIYRAESSLLTSMVEEKLAEKIVEKRETLEKRINKIYEELCTTLPAVLTTKAYQHFVPHGIEIKCEGETPVVSVGLVSWFRKGTAYLQPAGLYELEVKKKFPVKMKDYDIMLHFKDSTPPASGSTSISYEELIESDRDLVESFAHLLITYLNHVHEAERETENMKMELELMEKELNKIYRDPVLLYSRMRNVPAGILLPSQLAGIIGEDDFRTRIDGKVAIEVDENRLQLALILLRAEAFNRAVVQEDWRWEPWYWYAEMKESTIFADLE